MIVSGGAVENESAFSDEKVPFSSGRGGYRLCD